MDGTGGQRANTSSKSVTINDDRWTTPVYRDRGIMEIDGVHLRRVLLSRDEQTMPAWCWHTVYDAGRNI